MIRNVTTVLVMSVGLVLPALSHAQTRDQQARGYVQSHEMRQVVQHSRAVGGTGDYSTRIVRQVPEPVGNSPAVVRDSSSTGSGYVITRDGRADYNPRTGAVSVTRTVDVPVAADEPRPTRATEQTPHATRTASTPARETTQHADAGRTSASLFTGADEPRVSESYQSVYDSSQVSTPQRVSNDQQPMRTYVVNQPQHAVQQAAHTSGSHTGQVYHNPHTYQSSHVVYGSPQPPQQQVYHAPQSAPTHTTVTHQHHHHHHYPTYHQPVYHYPVYHSTVVYRCPRVYGFSVRPAWRPAPHYYHHRPVVHYPRYHCSSRIYFGGHIRYSSSRWGIGIRF